MKNLLMGLALVTALSSAAFAGDTTKEKKAKKAKVEAKATKAKAENCEKGTAAHPCCMKKVQA